MQLYQQLSRSLGCRANIGKGVLESDYGLLHGKESKIEKRVYYKMPIAACKKLGELPIVLTRKQMTPNDRMREFYRNPMRMTFSIAESEKKAQWMETPSAFC